MASEIVNTQTDPSKTVVKEYLGGGWLWVLPIIVFCWAPWCPLLPTEQGEVEWSAQIALAVISACVASLIVSFLVRVRILRDTSLGTRAGLPLAFSSYPVIIEP